jgi:hypothetical protein
MEGNVRLATRSKSKAADRSVRPTRYNPGVWRKLELRADWQIALAITAALRVFYSAAAAALSFALHPNPIRIHSNALTTNLPADGGLHKALLGVWERFDTLWYLHIAQHGYDQPMAVIFYPLYPAAIRMVNWALPATLAALVISTVAAFFVYWGLLRLVGPELSAKGRIRMLLLVAVWPTNFILFAGYAESLTLALIVWAVVLAREGQWWAAALCGFLAGLGRPSGVLVSIPLFVLAWRSRRSASLPVLLAPLGTFGYWGWLQWSGRLPVVEAYRLYQGTPLAPPWESLTLALRMIAGGEALLAIKLGLVALAAVLSLRREVRLEDKLFAVAIILQMLMYTGRPLIGAARHALMIYPAFLAWGAYLERRWNGTQFSFYVAALGLLNLAWMVAFLNWLPEL